MSSLVHAPMRQYAVISLDKVRFSFGKKQSAICDLLQHTFVAVVVLLYSENALSTALRAFISF